MRLAAESGELAGACFQWESIKTTWSKGLDSGEVMVVIQSQSQTPSGSFVESRERHR